MNFLSSNQLEPPSLATLDAGDLSADRTLTLPDVTGTIATIDGGQTFTSGTWQGTAVGAQYGGTGVNGAQLLMVVSLSVMVQATP